MTKYYDIPEEPVYNPQIRELQDTDRASATDTFNPLFSQLIENTEAVRNEKIDKSSIAQEIGANEDMVMSQQAVTNALAEIGTGGSVVLQSIMAAIYPVGSIYMSANNTNPGELFGGTWEAWGNGKVPVGVDTSDSDFNTSGKTGGVKNVTLTAAQSGIQNHNHTFTGTAVTSGTQSANHTHAITGGKHSHAENYNSWINAKGTNYVTTGSTGMYLNTVTTGREQIYTYDATPSMTCGNNSANHTHSVTATGTIGQTTANATAAHSNLQPYITCYMWKRTA